jgi:hypothetical protein
VSLASFQRALCDLIASPDLCVRLNHAPDELWSRYDLSPRERRRLAAIVQQRGMSTTCTLYRVNRITPLYTLMPLTSFLLGDRLIAEAEAYWAEFPGSDLQFRLEVERFAGFLRARLRTGELEDPYLEEILDFETAAATLRYAGRSGGSDALVRIVHFRHDPELLLRLLTERRRPLWLPAADAFVELDARRGALELRIVKCDATPVPA